MEYSSMYSSMPASALKARHKSVTNRLNQLLKFTPTELTKRELDERAKLGHELIDLDQEMRKSGGRMTLPGGTINMISKDGPFKSLGEQLTAIRNAGLPGGKIDNRLYEISEIRAASGLSETVPADGGFLLQPDFSNQILTNVWDTSLLLDRCRKITLQGPSMKIPGIDETSRATGSRFGGIRGYWVDEAGEKTASKPKFRQVELNLRKLVVLCYATDELLEDAGALGDYISMAATAELKFLAEDSVISGTGAGQPLGILNSGALVTVAAEGGQANYSIVYANVLKMYSRLPAANRPNAVWLIEQSCEPQLFSMSLAVGSGGSAVYLPPLGASVRPYGTLLGLPVIVSEHSKALGSVGDILLADLSQYLLAERSGGIKSDMSINVRFIYDESVFRFVLRIDGQPALASPITPMSGGDTLSPFVALAARTA